MYYVSLSTEGLFAGSGYYHMATDQLARFREAVDDDATGAERATLVAAAVAAGNDVGADDALKTAPRGYAKDHPRIDLLRRKGLTVWRGWPARPGCTPPGPRIASRACGAMPARSRRGSTPTSVRASCRPTTADREAA